MSRVALDGMSQAPSAEDAYFGIQLPHVIPRALSPEVAPACVVATILGGTKVSSRVTLFTDDARRSYQVFTPALWYTTLALSTRDNLGLPKRP